MLCEPFLKMTPLEASTYIGKLVHCVQNNPDLFLAGEKLIKKGEKMGLFEGVVINPLPPLEDIGRMAEP